MVDEIYEYIPNLHGNHRLCYFMNDCRIILKQKNPSEGSDVRSSKKRENSKSVSNHNASCCPVTDVLFVKRLEYKKRKNMLKTLVKCVSKTAEEKLITMPPVGEITLERMTDTRKPSKTLKPLKSKPPTIPYKHYFQYIVQYVMGGIV